MRIYSEVFTLFEILGDIEGASVLELACSDGYFSRHLSEWGAGKVVAIDISPEMIAPMPELTAVGGNDSMRHPFAMPERRLGKKFQTGEEWSAQWIRTSSTCSIDLPTAA